MFVGLSKSDDHHIIWWLLKQRSWRVISFNEFNDIFYPPVTLEPNTKTESNLIIVERGIILVLLPKTRYKKHTHTHSQHYAKA